MKNLKDFYGLETAVKASAESFLAGFLGTVLSSMNERLCKDAWRKKKYNIWRHDLRTLITSVDDVVFESTYFRRRDEDGKYPIIEGGSSLLDKATLLSLDFCYAGLSCRLQVELYDDYYYGLSLFYNYEEKIEEEKHWVLKQTFYSILKPIFGNDGHEQALFSLNQLQKEDYTLFNSNFYLSRTVYAKMLNKVISVNNTIEMEDGIYFLKQNKWVSKLLFDMILKYGR